MHTTILPLPNQQELDSSYSAIGGEIVNGLLRFAGCTHMPGMPAVLYNFDIAMDKVYRFSDTNLILPEGNLHGKIHTAIVTDNSQNSYCATHFAYPYGLPQPIEYSGSRLISIGREGVAVDLGLVKANNGVINIAIDKKRNLIYLLTIPNASLIQYDIDNERFTNLGDIPSATSVSRSFALDQDGNVFGCYEDGGLFIYWQENNRLEFHDRFLPIPQSEQWNSASRGGVNKLDRSLWRTIYFSPERRKFYGMLSSESRVFSLDPIDLTLVLGAEVFPKHTSLQRKTNVFPTLSLVNEVDNLFYASSIGLFDYNRTEQSEGYSHLMRINKDTLTTTDMGVIDDGKRRIYGIMTATMINGEYIAVGAVERVGDEAYNTFNVIKGKPFVIAVIRIKV